MRTPPLLADFILSRVCKPFCEKSLTLPPGQVFDKERLYESAWGLDGIGNNSVVAEHIRKIRAKFAAVGAKQYIETVWGVGYKWQK